MATIDPSLKLGPLADDDVHREVERFLVVESELLDNLRMRDWAALLTDDFTYEVPVGVTWDNPDRIPYSSDFFFVEEDRHSMELWFERLTPENREFAWGENPSQRIRHFITNVRARWRNDSELDVRSNLLYSFTRLTNPTVLVSGERSDTLRRDAQGGWKLARRVVYLDQTIQDLEHMHLVF